MSTKQKLSDEQLAALYISQRPQSPASLDERVLELARERAPQAAARGWQWSPAWSGVAVVCVLALWVPGLLESPAVDVSGVPPSAAMLKSDTAVLSKRAASEMQRAQQGARSQAGAAERAFSLDSDVAATAVPMMSAARPALAELVVDAADDEAAIHPTSVAWLQTITDLLAADDLIGAQTAFAEFRQVYPDAEVDAALLERLAIKP
jgi:hypothetical protein